jgi:hypothetical protein
MAKTPMRHYSKRKSEKKLKITLDERDTLKVGIQMQTIL